MPHPDITIAGAGIIGLSLALELHHRGYSVSVLDRAHPLAEASTAAAGMLAVEDPDNPPALLPLSRLSLDLYPAFLDRLHHLSGHRTPFQTHRTLQSLPHHPGTLDPLAPNDLQRLLPLLTPGNLSFALLDEVSLDPRQLAHTLLASIAATSIDLSHHTPVLEVVDHPHSLDLLTPSGMRHTGNLVDCTGAWSLSAPFLPHLSITPRKGQMLALSTPSSLDLVLRTPELYLVPRTTGPSAGRTILGATIEDVGFDKSVHPTPLNHLRDQATRLLPQLEESRVLESWAGLRPATPDNLPILGALPHNQHRWVAGGHFRNGILLAPATARVLADLLSGHPPAIDLAPSPPPAVPLLQPKQHLHRQPIFVQTCDNRFPARL